jgi:thiamine-monophosphate kinase
VKSETAIVEHLRRLAPAPPGSGLVMGIGDDCAIFRPRSPREDLLFTTDMLIEARHFLPATHPAGALGHKALARGLSDIAAMGGEPRFCLLSLALAEWVDDRWLRLFWRGLLSLASRACCPLAGGDLARAERFSCDIVVCGAVPRGRALRRDAAKPGDAIYVSGQLGGSALGLERGRGPAWKRHTQPEPRVALGRFLRRIGVKAAMDLSDGLSLDLRRMCLASKVAAEISEPPRFPGASAEQALHGGEDYELVFTAGPRTRVPEQFEGLPLTRIGAIVAGPAGRVRLNGRTLAPGGWDHFRA